jgi:hypothetical protein
VIGEVEVDLSRLLDVIHSDQKEEDLMPPFVQLWDRVDNVPLLVFIEEARDVLSVIVEAAKEFHSYQLKNSLTD